MLITGFLLLLPFLPGRAQEASSGEGPKADPILIGVALSWDRDFDLIYDWETPPEPERAVAGRRREGYELERKALEDRLADLTARMAAVQGSYSTEALLKEMLAQDVASLQEVQDNLRKEMADTERRIKEVDQVLRRLAQEAKP
ncbi:MAG: hypothetical protein ACOYXN_06755 [Acidobacteriota bacterium]